MLRAIVYTFHVVLGLAFMFAGVAKLRAPYEFLSTTYNYGLFDPASGLAFAMGLPWVEIVVGVALLGGVLTLGAELLGIILLSVRAILELGAIMGTPVDSGACVTCDISQPVTWLTLICTICLCLIAVCVLVMNQRLTGSSPTGALAND